MDATREHLQRRAWGTTARCPARMAATAACLALLASACSAPPRDSASAPPQRPRATQTPETPQALPYQPGQPSRHRGVPPWRQQGKQRVLNRAALEPNCSNTSAGLNPLPDLATGSYHGEQGGLYPGGANTLPSSHKTEGVERAEAIEPLSGSGNPSSTGSYVLLSIGMSNTETEFKGFELAADADPDKDPNLVIVNGAQGGIEAWEWADPQHFAWDKLDERLAAEGVTAAQVAVVWAKLANKASQDQTGPFPAFPEELRADSAEIARILEDRFPNLKLAYFSSRIYGGYAATDALNAEPFAYESGFAVKWLIEDQLEDDPTLNFDPAEGPVTAPWMAWGPYMWADGLEPRSDGLIWECSDFDVDGIHPSDSGVDKVATLLLDFFKSDATASPWFCSGPCKGLSSADLTTSLAANRSKNGYMKPFTLSGTVGSGADCNGPFSISLTKKVNGSDDSSVIASGVTPGANGVWSFGYESKRSASYRAAPSGSSGCVPKPSAWVPVRVRAGVTANVPAGCDAPQSIRGRVRPRHAGTDVVLKRRTGGRWDTVDRDRLNARSRFVLEAPVCSGKFKAVWPKQAPDNIRGTYRFSL